MLSSATIEKVHDPENGRISALRVSELYKLKLSLLAAIIGQNYETLRKNPSREEAQPALAKLTHAWNQLEGIFADRSQIARWLRHPLPDGQRPLDMLTNGRDGLAEFSRLIGRIATGTYR